MNPLPKYILKLKLKSDFYLIRLAFKRTAYIQDHTAGFMLCGHDLCHTQKAPISQMTLQKVENAQLITICTMQ